MKKKFYKFINHKTRRNVLIFLLVIMLIVVSFPLMGNDSIVKSPIETGWKVSAVEYNTADDTTSGFTYDASDADHKIYINLDDLVRYSEAYQRYPRYHQHDSVVISTTNSQALTLDGFQSLGNEGYPFAGSIQFMDFTDSEIFLDVSLFDVVYDTAKINNSKWIRLSRIKTNRSLEAK